MNTSSQIDFRKDQVKILKLEERALKPLALSLLNAKVAKNAKLGAVAATIMTLTSLEGASADCLTKANASADAMQSSTIAHKTAIKDLNRLSALVSDGANIDSMKPVLVSVFKLVDQEHQRLEAIVKSKNGRLLIHRNNPSAIGNGKKEPPAQWLTQLLIRAS